MDLAEPRNRLANKFYLKAADCAALEGRVEKDEVIEYDGYGIASEYFKEVAEDAITNNLMRWSVKDYLLKLGICRIATVDMPYIINGINLTREIDNDFETTREYHLLMNLQEAVKDKDSDQFASHLFEFDKLSKLDSWKTTLLLRTKEKLIKSENDFS